MKKFALLFLAASFGIASADPAPISAKLMPSKDAPQPVPADVTFTRDVVYGNAGGHPLYLHISVPKTTPDKPMPVLIYIHGGGWHGGTRDAGVGATYIFAEHGYVGASIEYRLAQEAPFPAQLEDCKCAVRFLRAKAADYHIDAAHIGVMGDSAGGHLVAMMGLTNGRKEFEGDGGYADQSSNVQAVCDWFGPTDLLSWLQQEPKFQKDPFLPQFLRGTYTDQPAHWKAASPMTYVESAKELPPFLIMHGTDDPNVPRAQSIALFEALSAEGDDVRMHVIKGVGHGGRPWGLANPWPEVLAFFDYALKPWGELR